MVDDSFEIPFNHSTHWKYKGLSKVAASCEVDASPFIKCKIKDLFNTKMCI